jgi:hypothetical protein
MARRMALADHGRDNKAIGSPPAIRSGSKEQAMTNRTATTAAIILSLAAVGAPAASAMPIDFVPVVHHSPTAIYDRPDKTMVPVNPPPPSAEPLANTSTPQSVVHVLTPNTGFDWGDAGIGAAGGIGIAMLATGGGLFAVRMRRDHHDPATR